MSFIVAEFPLNSDCHRGVKSPDLSGRLPQIFENSGISCNCVRLPPGVIISRISEILPRCSRFLGVYSGLNPHPPCVIPCVIQIPKIITLCLP